MVNWISVLMAGAGAAVAQLDPSMLTQPQAMLVLVIKGFVGGAVGAYFGNHLSGAGNGKTELPAKETN